MRRGSRTRWSLGAVLVAAVLLGCGDSSPPTRVSTPYAAPYATAPHGAPVPPAPDPIDARAIVLARAAVEAIQEDPMRGLLLAREAARVDHTPEVLEALHRALDATRGDAPFHAHRGNTLSATWSPDGTRILTTSLDMTARLWTPAGEPVAVLEGHEGSIHQAAWAAGGARILTASVDHTAREWQDDGTLLATYRVHDAEVQSATWSRDTAEILTVSLDGTAWLRQVTGAAVRIAEERRGVLGAWHRDGGAFVVLRDVGGGFATFRDGRVALLGGRVNDVVDAVPCPLDDRLLLLTEGDEVLLLDAGTNKTTVLKGHAAQALDAAFSKSGQKLATASLDATARIWTAAGKELAVLEGHGGAVHSVSFGLDDGFVLTVSWDRSAHIWESSGTLHAAIGGESDPVATAVFSPTGRQILTTAYQQGPAAVWTVNGELVQVLPDDTGRTIEATWSPDGTRILTLDRTLTPHVRFADVTALVAAADAAIDRELTADEQRVMDRIMATQATVTDASARFPSARPEATPDTEVLRGDYAGTVVCASCHHEAYAGWVKSSHARTSYFANVDDMPADVLEGKTVEHPPLTTTYVKTDGGWIARTLGDDGQEHDFPLTMVSGHLRIRFFMTKMPDGRLQVLPAMYELPENEWFDYTHLIFGAGGDFETPPTIAPGDPTYWTGPVRSWDARCAHCHMSGKSPIARKAGEVGPRIVWRAYAVDCEACHGPARLHAEAWARLEMDETLTRIERLTRSERVTACTQCHQEGEVLSPPFAPGQDLYEYIDPTVVVDPERCDPSGRPTELIYDGLPFAVSTCANAGGLVCSDCHAPHGSEHRSLLRKPTKDGWFCASCHAEYVKEPEAHSHHSAAGSGSNCALCHMPFLSIERGHGAVADHTIGIPRLGLIADRTQPDACTWCHSQGLGAPTDAPALTEEELWRAYEDWWPGSDGWPQPWMAALANARLGERDAGAALVGLLKDETLPREVRASAAQLLGRYAAELEDAIFEASKDGDSLVRRNAIRSLAAVKGARADKRLLEALSDPSWAVRVAAARTALDGWTRVQDNRALLEAIVPVLRKDAEKVPDDDVRWFRLGAAYDLMKDHEHALEAYERKAALDPYAPAIRKHIKNLKALLGHDTED